MMAVQLSTFPLSVKTEIFQFVMTGEGKGGWGGSSQLLLGSCLYIFLGSDHHLVYTRECVKKKIGLK